MRWLTAGSTVAYMTFIRILPSWTHVRHAACPEASCFRRTAPCSDPNCAAPTSIVVRPHSPKETPSLLFSRHVGMPQPLARAESIAPETMGAGDDAGVAASASTPTALLLARPARKYEGMHNATSLELFELSRKQGRPRPSGDPIVQTAESNSVEESFAGLGAEGAAHPAVKIACHGPNNFGSDIFEVGHDTTIVGHNDAEGWEVMGDLPLRPSLAEGLDRSLVKSSGHRHGLSASGFDLQCPFCAQASLEYFRCLNCAPQRAAREEEIVHEAAATN